MLAGDTNLPRPACIDTCKVLDTSPRT